MEGRQDKMKENRTKLYRDVFLYRFLPAAGELIYIYIYTLNFLPASLHQKSHCLLLLCSTYLPRWHHSGVFFTQEMLNILDLLVLFYFPMRSKVLWASIVLTDIILSDFRLNSPRFFSEVDSKDWSQEEFVGEINHF